MSPRTILVAGGAGFIGANFVQLLRARDLARVINLDKLTYAGNLSSLEPLAEDAGHVFVRGDIGDAAQVRELLETHRPGAVVNFAAESHVDRSIVGPAPFIETNLVGTFVLLQELLTYWSGLNAQHQAVFRFLHVSTDEVYGSLKPEEPAFTEDSPYRPNSPYAASKAGADHLVRAYHHTYRLPVITSNCSNNYGPYQYPEKLIPLMILHALQGNPLPVYGDGQQVRDWLYVTDHCEALWRVLQAGRPGETYNIGGDAERANLDVVRRICAILAELLPESPHAPFEQLIAFVADRPGHDRRYAIDAGQMKKELGWQPAESFESGLRRAVVWYLEHPAWVATVGGPAYESWLSTNYGERASAVKRAATGERR